MDLSLGSHAVPNDYYPQRVHVYSAKEDTYRPYKTCPIVESEIKRRQNSSELRHFLDVKYNSTLRRLALTLGKDPSTFNSFTALKYIERIYSMWID